MSEKLPSELKGKESKSYDSYKKWTIMDCLLGPAMGLAFEDQNYTRCLWCWKFSSTPLNQSSSYFCGSCRGTKPELSRFDESELYEKLSQ